MPWTYVSRDIAIRLLYNLDDLFRAQAFMQEPQTILLTQKAVRVFRVLVAASTDSPQLRYNNVVFWVNPIAVCGSVEFVSLTCLRLAKLEHACCMHMLWLRLVNVFKVTTCWCAHRGSALCYCDGCKKDVHNFLEPGYRDKCINVTVFFLLV